MYRCVLFDMDGTLINSYEGIYHAYRWALKQVGLVFPGEAFVRKAIGAPLPLVFEQHCGMNREQTAKAIRCYREYYDQKGKHEASVYDGMHDCLKQLKLAGCLLGAATLKRETYAKEMLEELRLLPYFDVVRGMDKDDRLSKADLIRRCLKDANCRKEEAVLVGDSEFDAAGAQEAGVDFLAVTYGFGFQTPGALEKHKVTMTAHSACEVAARLCGETKGQSR